MKISRCMVVAGLLIIAHLSSGQTIKSRARTRPPAKEAEFTVLSAPKKTKAKSKSKQKEEKEKLKEAMDLVRQPLDFEVKRAWSSPRWYLIGYVDWPKRINWLDGPETPIEFSLPHCSTSQDYSTAVFKRMLQKTLDISITAKWIAIEVSPVAPEAELLIRSPETYECYAKVRVPYIINHIDGTRPLLMTNARGNFISKYDVNFLYVGDQKDNGFTAKITTGVWRARFPNAKDNKIANFFMMPVGEVLLDWKYIRDNRRLGAQFEYKQNTLSPGSKYKTQVSDFYLNHWYSFWVRPRFKHSQQIFFGYASHQATDTPAIYSVAPFNHIGKYFMFGWQVTQFFKTRNFVELHIASGLPNRMAGQGRKQNHQYARFEYGFYLSEQSAFIMNVERKLYSAQGYKTERIDSFTSGFKLHF